MGWSFAGPSIPDTPPCGRITRPIDQGGDGHGQCKRTRRTARLSGEGDDCCRRCSRSIRGAQLGARGDVPGRRAGAACRSLAIGNEEYLLSALFGVLFAGLADPGGSYGYRGSRIAVFALTGAGATALGFGIGWDDGLAGACGFCCHAPAGLTVEFGVHRFVAALLLNLWFFVVLGLRSSLQHMPMSPVTPGLRCSPG